MANDAKKVSELGITTSLSANDRIVVLTNPTSTPVTQTITLTNLIANSTPNILGPFSNDSLASAGGVLLKRFYYDSAGNVKIRLT
jgi:hypothetical protein